jgi:bifunctional aspartokinase / homoserine dehydrogenase 1
MSDCVIRFGGDSCNNSTFIKELAGYLKQKNSHRFIVVSSIPKIYKLISESIEQVYSENDGSAVLGQSLSKTFMEITATNPTVEYIDLTNKIEQLFRGISLTGDYSPALRDLVFSFNEKLSSLIFQFQLHREGINTKLILPEDFGFCVTADFGNATYLSIAIEKLKLLPSDTVYIIPGSYGLTNTGKIARAGNSASDYTAAALTASLQASELILWGLEKDFYSADPNIVLNPTKISRLTYSEASELAYFDHYSFHPRTVEPLEEKHIPIKIVSAKSFQVETIINTDTYILEQIVKGVAYSDDISLLKLDGPGVGLKPGILAKVTTALSQAGINVKSVITAQVSINFILGKKEGAKALDIISQLGFTAVREIKVIDDVSLIGVVGHGMQQDYGVSAKLFTAVARNKISVLLSGSGASDLVSYLVVKQSDRDKCIREIYKEFYSYEPRAMSYEP